MESDNPSISAPVWNKREREKEGLREKKRQKTSTRMGEPTIDDCLWCHKTVAKPTRCNTCKQAYHSRCASQCGYLDTGALKKCCNATPRVDASFSAVELDNDADGSSNSSASEVGDSRDTVESFKPTKTSRGVTEAYLNTTLSSKKLNMLFL